MVLSFFFFSFFLFFFVTVHRDTEILCRGEHCIVLQILAGIVPVHKVGCASLAIMTMRVKATTTTDRLTDRQTSGDHNTIRVPVKHRNAPPVKHAPSTSTSTHQSIYLSTNLSDHPPIKYSTSTMHYSKAPYCKTISKTMYHIIARPGAGQPIMYHHIGFSILRKKEKLSFNHTYLQYEYLRKSNLDENFKSIKKDGKKKRGIL